MVTDGVDDRALSIQKQSMAKSQKVRRGYWGPSRDQEINEATVQLMDEGVLPSDFKTRKDYEVQRQSRIERNRQDRGKMVYSSEAGGLIPDPRAAAEANAITQEKWDAQQLQAASDSKKADKARGILARDYWAENPTAKKTAIVKDFSGDPEVQAAVATGNSKKIKEALKAANTRAMASGTETSITADGATENASAMKVRAVDLPSLAANIEANKKAESLAQQERNKYNNTKVAEAKKFYQDQRRENEKASADRYATFVANNAENERLDRQGQAYLNAVNQQYAGMRKTAREAYRDGRPILDQGFWDAYSGLAQVKTQSGSLGVDKARRWASSEVLAEENKRNEEERLRREVSNSLSSGGGLTGLTERFFNDVTNMTYDLMRPIVRDNRGASAR